MNRLTERTKIFGLINILISAILVDNFVQCANINSSLLTNESKVCNTEGCKQIGIEILRKMNLNADPCDDFYEFACGSFSKNTITSNSESAVDSFRLIGNTIQKELRASIENYYVTESDPHTFNTLQAYYNICMNEDLMENNSEKEFLDLLKTMGGWPVLSGESWNKSNFDWKKTINKVYELGFIGSYIIHISIENDLKNNSRRIVYVDQAAFGIPYDFLLQGWKQGYFLEKYFNYMVDLAVLLGADRNQSSLELRESLNFEIELAKISLPTSRVFDPLAWENLLTVDELQSKYPVVQWNEYLKNFMKSELNNTDLIAVVAPSFLNNLSRLLDKTPERVLANYIYWRVVEDSAETLSRKIRERYRKFKEVVTGSKNKFMWQECVDHVKKEFNLATASLYVRKYFSKQSKDSVSEIMVELKNNFRNMLTKVDWMANITKEKALEKLDHMLNLVGYPDELLSNEILDDYYNEFKIIPDSFLKNMLEFNIFKVKKMVKNFRKPVMKNEWSDIHGAITTMVNAFYMPNTNSLLIPAAILQGSVFNEEHPKYINYASIGSIAGHEVTHGFDFQRRKFDKNGNLIDWWDPESEKEYKNKTQCIVKQYSKYKSADSRESKNVDGFETRDENIADNGGIKAAYYAYEAWLNKNGEESRLPQLEFTSKKMFWISYASSYCTENPTFIFAGQTHAPHKYRIIGSLSNTPEFSKDFNCPLGSNMNPVEKCSVW